MDCDIISSRLLTSFGMFRTRLPQYFFLCSLYPLFRRNFSSISILDCLLGTLASVIVLALLGPFISVTVMYIVSSIPMMKASAPAYTFLSLTFRAFPCLPQSYHNIHFLIIFVILNSNFPVLLIDIFSSFQAVLRKLPLVPSIGFYSFPRLFIHVL